MSQSLPGLRMSGMATQWQGADAALGACDVSVHRGVSWQGCLDTLPQLATSIQTFRKSGTTLPLRIRNLAVTSWRHMTCFFDLV